MPGPAFLIIVDNEPLLKAEQDRLRAAKLRLDVVQTRVTFHQKADEPQYQQWINGQFAEQLSSIRSLYMKLADLDSLIHEVEMECLATGCDPLEAYDRLMQLRSELKDRASSAAYERGRDPEAESLEREEEEARERARRESGADEHDTDSGFHSQNGNGNGDGYGKRQTPRSKRQLESDEQIKTIYRQLVRKLHPDLNPDLTPAQRELWFEVQQAYVDQDLSRLEMLQARAESDEAEAGGDSFIAKIRSLTRLRLLVKALTKKIKKAQREIAQAKRTPAWDFHKIKRDPRKMDRLAKAVRAELSDAEETLESDVRTLESQIERWTRRTRSRRVRSNVSRGERHPW